jgi:glycosyltransferase 2 family protein
LRVNRKTLKWIAQLFVTAALMYLAFRKVDTGELHRVLSGMKILPLMLVPVLLALDLLLNSYRVKGLYYFYGIRTKLSSVIKIKFQGLFFSLFFPLLGDAYKIRAFKGEYGASYWKNSLVVFLDRLIFTLGLTIILVPVWVLSIIKVHDFLKAGIIVLFIIEITLLILLNQPEILGWFKNFFSRTKLNGLLCQVNMGKRSGYLIELSKNTAVAILRHFIDGIFFLTIAYAILHQIDFNVFLFIFCVFSITLARVIPVSVGGIGLREYIALLIFPQIGLDAEIGFTIAFVVSSIYILQGMLGGIWFLFSKATNSLVT